MPAHIQHYSKTIDPASIVLLLPPAAHRGFRTAPGPGDPSVTLVALSVRLRIVFKDTTPTNTKRWTIFLRVSWFFSAMLCRFDHFYEYNHSKEKLVHFCYFTSILTCVCHTRTAALLFDRAMARDEGAQANLVSQDTNIVAWSWINRPLDLEQDSMWSVKLNISETETYT